MPLSNEDFLFIQKLVKNEIGIVLEAGKEYLVESRLTPLVDTEKTESLEKLINILKNPVIGGTNALKIKRSVLDAMTTNETLFFRDSKPFEALKTEIMPKLLDKLAAKKKLRVWCAAASTGQEPYSIAMTLLDTFPQLLSWDIKIQATDICSVALEKAKKGEYTQFEVNRGLPVQLLTKYFSQAGLKWKIKDSLKSIIQYQEMNLLSSWSIIEPCDVIFMRNVLIYFDEATKRSIMKSIPKVLTPEGYITLGGSEAIIDPEVKFERQTYAGAVFYRLPGVKG
jgi:chemotaxis protein methyltransferase CheR